MIVHEIIRQLAVVLLSGTILATPTPRIERPGGAVENRPKAFQVRDWQRSEVSWYGRKFYGNGTACGQTYNGTILGVAHKTLPCGTLVEFTHRGSTVIVPVIDRGPYVEGRDWDLSAGLCKILRHCFTGDIKWRIVSRIGNG